MMVSGATLDQVRMTMDRWMIAGSGLEVVTELEQSALRRFLQTVSRTAECKASALLVIERLEKIDIPKKLLKSLRSKFKGLANPKSMWTQYWCELRQAITCSDNRTFSVGEQQFLQKLLKCRYFSQVNSNDHRKVYTKFENRSFWSAVAYDFNVKFSQGMRDESKIKQKARKYGMLGPDKEKEKASLKRPRELENLESTHSKRCAPSKQDENVDELIRLSEGEINRLTTVPEEFRSHGLSHGLLIPLDSSQQHMEHSHQLTQDDHCEGPDQPIEMHGTRQFSPQERSHHFD